MAIAGSWFAGAVTPSEYIGATRWGTGVNPIHAQRNQGTRDTGIKENLLPLGTATEGGFVPENILGPAMWGYSSEDAALFPGEDYRYLEADHPNWGDTMVGRPDRDGEIFAAGREPQPEGWPSWGPHGVEDPDMPVASWPGGETLRSYADGGDVENSRVIAAPTPGWRGGWLNKAHGAVEEAETSDPSQYEMTTSLTQLHQTRVNDAAVVRGTDELRAPIETRLTGMKARYFAKSEHMGGGPGSPDMAPVTQGLPYRPWFYRQGAMPPPPDTTWGTMTAFDPIRRNPPATARGTITLSEEGAPDATYGYSEGDYFG
jgi:hypothetical protein